MSTWTTHLSGFNQYPTKLCKLVRPARYNELQTIKGTLITRGQGQSYGDCALLEDGYVIQTSQLNRFLAFNKKQGIITAESGATLAELLAISVPAGWFLPVTPGTQYVSLGGCVASDVHGKNHLKQGSFGQHVQQFELITAKQTAITCSPQTNAEIFWATIAGMGLTGIIGEVHLKLLPIESAYLSVQHHEAQQLENVLHSLDETAHKHDYAVAWIDALATHADFGRGVIMAADHAKLAELPLNLQQNPLSMTSQFSWSLPWQFPNGLINTTTIHHFNHWYYQRCIKKQTPYLTNFQQYFYPLDSIRHWNRFYGARGFIQYQCTFPNSSALQGIQQILETLQKTHCPVALAVIKYFGKADAALLSFPQPGFTLALDIPLYDTLFSLLDQLDQLVLQHQGRVYLAKDARLKPDIFRAMYPKYSSWLAIKKQIDPDNLFRSSMSQRLRIGEL